jgi:hypothetical protein
MNKGFITLGSELAHDRSDRPDARKIVLKTQASGTLPAFGARPRRPMSAWTRCCRSSRSAGASEASATPATKNARVGSHRVDAPKGHRANGLNFIGRPPYRTLPWSKRSAAFASAPTAIERRDFGSPTLRHADIGLP